MRAGIPAGMTASATDHPSSSSESLSGTVHEAALLLREEITRLGSISFDRFMEVALYHPVCGYYCQPEQPIGKRGDFFTASQVQPVFGRLIRSYCERLRAQHLPGLPDAITEVGPGRGEMAQSFQDWSYRGIHAGAALQLDGFQGIVFANELFDALPVKLARVREGRYLERRVSLEGEAFCWVDEQDESGAIASYAELHKVPHQEVFEFEIHAQSVTLLREMLGQMESGLLIFIDYGYTEREWKRFPAGTLMSYRRHQAAPDVLNQPGRSDITSHVPFTILMNEARACGAELLRFESMAQALLFAGETDEFSAALRVPDSLMEQEAKHTSLLRQQLKLLLYGMGENFRVLALRKVNALRTEERGGVDK